MSDFYQRFRSEMAAGGAVDEHDQARRSGRLTGVVMVAMLAWLAVSSIWTFVFVVGLIVSVFLHEVGHFSTARLTGMKSTQFFMGFGPRVWSTTRGEVEYGVRALPVGAFVRIVGMNNLDEVDPGDEDRAYRSKSYPRKLLVITAGSLMHMVIAAVLFVGVYVAAGREQNTGSVVIKDLAARDGPAFAAGLRVGDMVVDIGGRAVTSYDSMVDAITSRSPGERVDVRFQRDGAVETVPVVMGRNPNSPTKAYLGVYADDVAWVRLSPVTAAREAASDIGATAWGSVKGVVVALNPLNSIRHLTNDDASLETRPTTLVGVSQVGGDIGRTDGWKGVLLLLASVNVFVGIFNMFPLLPFDGGHAAIATYERIRSRRGKRYVADISKMVPVATGVVGLLAVLLLTGLWLDITRPLG